MTWGEEARRYNGGKGRSPFHGMAFARNGTAPPCLPPGGKDERTVSKQHSCCFECAERSGRMVRAPAVTEPPVALAGGEKQTALLADG